MKWHEFLGTTPEEKLKTFIHTMETIIIALSAALIWSQYNYIALHHTVYSGCSLLCMNSTSCEQRCYTYYTYPQAQIQKIRYEQVMNRDEYKYENPSSYDWMEAYRQYDDGEKMVRNMQDGTNASIWT